MIIPSTLAASARPFGSPNGTPANPGLRSAIDRGSTNQYAHQLDVLQREISRDPGFQDSVALQTRWRTGIDAIAMEQRMDNKSNLLRLKTAAWQEITDFIYYYRTHFEATVARETDNFDFYYGYQWDDAEIKRLQKLWQVPHVSNYMTRWIRTLLGEQRGAETAFKFESEDDSLQPITELYGQVCRKIARANRWSKKSSDFFANLTVGGRAFASVSPDPFDPLRKIQMRNERYEEFMYDFEHAQDGTLEGCNYIMRTYYRDLEEVIFQYPEWEDYLLNYDYAAASGIEQLMLFTVATPKVPPTAYKRVVSLPERFVQRPFFQRRRVAWMTEFYRIGGIKQWSVHDGNFDIAYDFAAEDAAIRFYRHLRDASIARNLAITGQPGLDLISVPVYITRKVLHTEVWCSNVLLDAFTRRVGRFPYVAQHNEFHRGEWRGYFEDDKPNQKMRNLLLVILSMQLGGMKGKAVYNRKLFSKESTEKQQQEMIRDPAKAMIVDLPLDTDIKRLAANISPAAAIDGATIRYLTELIEKASDFSNGGVSLVGGADFAGQSAKSSRTLQQSAQTGIENAVADMRDSETQVGQMLAYQASFLPPTRILSLVNAEDRPRMLPLLQNMSHRIELDAFQIATTEVLSGPTRSSQQAAELLEVAGQDPELLSDIMPEVMRLRRFPQGMVDRIDQRTQAREQASGAAAQHEQEMSDRDMLSKISDRDAKAEIAREQVDIQRNPPVGYTIVAKTNAPGQDAMAEIFKQHNIDATPDKIAQSEQMQNQQDQQRDNARQKSQQAIDLPYQRSLARIHPAEPKRPTGKKQTGGAIRSSKDRNNRSRKKPERTKTQST